MPSNPSKKAKELKCFWNWLLQFWLLVHDLSTTNYRHVLCGCQTVSVLSSSGGRKDVWHADDSLNKAVKWLIWLWARFSTLSPPDSCWACVPPGTIWPSDYSSPQLHPPLTMRDGCCSFAVACKLSCPSYLDFLICSSVINWTPKCFYQKGGLLHREWVNYYSELLHVPLN